MTMENQRHGAPESSAFIETEHASRYLQQLCKHFAHKRPVEFDPSAGHIAFDIGDCRLSTDEVGLRIDLVAPSPAAMHRLKDVVIRHLERFAFREELAVNWTDAAEGPIGEYRLDDTLLAVLKTYHDRMAAERQRPPEDVPGGRDGGQDQRMRAIGPDTGRFLNTLVRSLDRPHVLELGTSFGYSGLWLADAARAAGGRLTTMEFHAYKSEFARMKAVEAGLADHIDFRVGDAVSMIGALERNVDFVFVDLWKDLYLPCLEAVLPLLNPGAILIADNMLRPGGEDVRRYQQALRARPDMTSVLLPIGSGLEVSRYEPA